MLEAGLALWFWAAFSQTAILPLLQETAVLKSSWAAEQAWHADEAAWGAGGMAAESVWRERTGCCVAFSRSVQAGCAGSNRVVFAKHVWRENGLDAFFVAAACGVS
ncbi:MAG: hypothetical protein Q8P02_00625 [Candidatus Micrarchaeota archaeon]|nr:hypothetical protein [Candidatus Micrarchaeota archaeon]